MTGLLLDVAVVVLAILLVMFGIWRGFYKLIFGLVTSVLALVLTIVLTGTVSTIIMEKTPIDERIAISLDEPLSKYIPNPNIEISFYDIDGDGEASELGFMLEEEIFAFEKALDGSYFKFVAGPLENIIRERLELRNEDDSYVYESVVLLQGVSATLVSYIMLVVVGIVLFIVLTILVKLIMSLVKKLVTKSYLGYFIDKLFGGVLGIGIAGLVVFGALTIIQLLGTYEWIIPVNKLIAESTLTKLLLENNFLYALLNETVNLNAMINGLIGKLGK